MGKISRDTPLAEITLRRYEKPTMGDRELVRRFCLSMGLLQPGDSRDVVVDVFYVLLQGRSRKEQLHSEEIKNEVMALRKRLGLPMLGIAGSNIRRQLKRLKDLHLIETNANLYRITEFGNLSEIFEEKVENFILTSVISRVKDYLQKIDEEFPVSVAGKQAQAARVHTAAARTNANVLEQPFNPELLAFVRPQRRR